MKKVIFIGKTGSGKTTLCQKLHDLELNYRKTQSVEIYDESIDTPGEYLENRFFYKALIVTAVDADIIALVYDCTEDESYLAPGFATMFAKDTIGVITKVALAKDEAAINRAEEILIAAGVGRVFKVDTLADKGIDDLIEYLNS